MLPALLATTLSMFGAYDDLGASGAGGELELLARVSDTRLVALNPSDRPQLLIFTTESGAVSARAVLPAGAGLEYDFPRGTLHGLGLELVARDEGGLRSTGQLSLAGLVRGGYELVWMESAGDGLYAFGELPSGPVPIQATRDADSGLHILTAPSTPAPHVPVITPTDKPKGDLPPRIEPEPLPPV